MDSKPRLPYESANRRDQRAEISRVCQFESMEFLRVAPYGSECAGVFEDILQLRRYSKLAQVAAESARL